MKRTSFSDIYDINKKTGALILGKNRLEDYATKFLAKYCKQVLVEPMPLPVEEILNEMKLTVEEATLSGNSDVFGCCLLLDTDVDVFDPEEGGYVTKSFSARTIIIDPTFEDTYGIGFKRNTLVHEAIHWEKDKKYFEILEIKNKNASEQLYPILCRRSKTFYTPPEGKKTKENEVKWLEWQAHRLAPRVLMPYKSFRQKAIEIIETVNKQEDNPWPCDTIIAELSAFFIVSRSSVKYRLLETDLKKYIEDLIDYNVVYSDVLDEEDYKEFKPLSPIEAYNMLEENPRLRKWVEAGQYLYVDGYFLNNVKESVELNKDGSLSISKKAKRNLEKYALNIVSRAYTEYPGFSKDVFEFSILNKQAGVADKRIAIFDPKYQVNQDYDIERAYQGAATDLTSEFEDELHITKIISDPEKSLCICIAEIMEYRGWKYPKTFTENTHLYDDLFGRIKKDEKNTMEKETLLAICVGLKLKVFHVEELMKKRGIVFNRYIIPDYVYIKIFERFPGISIIDFNGMLEAKNIKPLGSK